jgi:hypothetical protein
MVELVDFEYTTLLISKIGKWIESAPPPEFTLYKSKQLAFTLADDLERKYGLVQEPEKGFTFSEDIDRQHGLLMAFLSLNQAISGLEDCEFYFRRYPFKGHEVPRASHIRNICELYFGYFYIIKCRIKIVFDHLQLNNPNARLKVGKFINGFQKAFEQEIRERNHVHHKDAFDDFAIDRLFLTNSIALNDDRDKKDRGWKREHMRQYRKVVKEWSARVRTRSAAVRQWENMVARAVLEFAPCFANKP